VQSKIANGALVKKRIDAGKTTRQIVDELYVRCFGRKPTDEEWKNIGPMLDPSPPGDGSGAGPGSRGGSLALPVTRARVGRKQRGGRAPETARGFALGPAELEGVHVQSLKNDARVVSSLSQGCGCLRCHLRCVATLCIRRRQGHLCKRCVTHPAHQLLRLPQSRQDKAGLDMTTYQGIMEGSDTRKVITPGDSANSVLFKCITHAATPTMPPKSDKIPDSQIEIIRKWIDGHALETADSQVVIAKNTTPALEMFAQEKADGPPPMPHDLLLDRLSKRNARAPWYRWPPARGRRLWPWPGKKQVLLYNTDTMELAGVLPFPEGFPQVVKFSRDRPPGDRPAAASAQSPAAWSCGTSPPASA